MTSIHVPRFDHDSRLQCSVTIVFVSTDAHSIWHKGKCVAYIMLEQKSYFKMLGIKAY